MKCLVCGTGKAIKDDFLGILPCRSCQDSQARSNKANRPVEFTSEEIKEGRKQSFRSTIQRFRDGELSREFVEAYPERAKDMVKNGIVTEKQVKNSRDVWGDISPMGGWERTQ